MANHLSEILNVKARLSDVFIELLVLFVSYK